MRFIFLQICVLLVVQHVVAQSREGVTGIPDTGFSISSEYKKLSKNYPQLQMVNSLDSTDILTKKNITYYKDASRELKLDVFYSPGKKKVKQVAIIFIHGGGWRSGNRFMHHPLAERLAALGYVCITPEYRLSTEALYPTGVQDVKEAIRWVRQNANKYNINSKAIVIAGHSAGGELAAFAGATNGNKKFNGHSIKANISADVNAVIDIDGTLAFVHPESGEGDDSKKKSAATLWFGYSKTENPAIWNEASPLTHVGASAPPFLFLNSSVDRMHAGRNDFISGLNKHNIYSEVKTFKASPHSFLLFNPWFDSTLIAIDKFCKKIFPAQKSLFVDKISVAHDGSGLFSTLQTAFDFIPLNNKSQITIHVKEGIYTEKLFLDSSKNNIHLAGEDVMNTILTWNDHTGKISHKGDTINTRTSWTFKIKADNFSATNITFQNDAGFTAGQAVAVESDGDKALFRNCRFVGNQDVLFLNNDKSRQYFENCYIEGTTDFIFGSATAWFQHCEIYSKKNSHVTAASTPASKNWGFVFDSCVLKGDTSLHNVSLGRPWRPTAAVVFMNSYIGEHIKPEGWSNWNNTDNYKYARYAEYKNFGPSSDPLKRVGWAKQLTDAEAMKYSVKNYLKSWQ